MLAFTERARSYETGDMVYDPVHYLSLIERKIMAFDQAAPLQGWELPKAFGTLQPLLEARQGKTGKREYVQVLRLLERFGMEELHGAVKDARAWGPSVLTPSNIWPCAARSIARHGWIWTPIRSCPE